MRSRNRAAMMFIAALFLSACPKHPDDRLVEPVDIKALGMTPIARAQRPPIYPAIARAANLIGTVVMEIVVDRDGNVTRVTVVKSQPPFDVPAVEAVRQWRYEPVHLRKRIVSWHAQVTLNFRLR